MVKFYCPDCGKELPETEFSLAIVRCPKEIKK